VYVEVHHKDGIRWQEILDYIFQQLLVNPDKLETNCEECHRRKDGGKTQE